MHHKNVIFTDTAIRTSTHLISRRQFFLNANLSWQWNETGPLASAVIYIDCLMTLSVALNIQPVGEAGNTELERMWQRTKKM
jgi:hypothetical protein